MFLFESNLLEADQFDGADEVSDEMDFGDLQESTTELVTSIAALNEAVFRQEFQLSQQALRESNPELLTEGVKETLKKWWEKIKAFFAKAWEKIKSFFSSVWSKIVSFVQSDVKWLEKNKEALNKVSFDKPFEIKTFPGILDGKGAGCVAQVENTLNRLAAEVNKNEVLEDSVIDNILSADAKSAAQILGVKGTQKVDIGTFKKVLSSAPSVLHAAKNVGNLNKSLNSFLKSSVTIEKNVDKDVNSGNSTAARKGAESAKLTQKAAKEGMKIVTKMVNVTRSHSMAILKKGLSHSSAAVKESTSLLFA